MTADLTKWERLELLLIDKNVANGTPIDNRWVADQLKVSNAQASEYIQSYVFAQRSPNVNTLFVLHREGRTSVATWIVGHSARDLRALNTMFGSDVKIKFKRAFEPDLVAMAEHNPRLAKKVKGLVDAVADGAFTVLAAALGVGSLDDE